MSRIGVLLDDMFEDAEYLGPAKRFKDTGHELLHIGIKKGPVKAEKGTATVEVDKEVGEVGPSDVDAVFIPGGFSPDRLRADERVVDFVRKFADSNKPLFFICHGAQVLITADRLKGRVCTGWKSIRKDIENAGATYLDQEVVLDRNFVSSRYPGDIPAFTEASLRKLRDAYA